MVWFTFPIELKPPEKKKLSDKIKEKEILQKNKQDELKKKVRKYDYFYHYSLMQ